MFYLAKNIHRATGGARGEWEGPSDFQEGAHSPPLVFIARSPRRWNWGSGIYLSHGRVMRCGQDGMDARRTAQAGFQGRVAPFSELSYGLDAPGLLQCTEGSIDAGA